MISTKSFTISVIIFIINSAFAIKLPDYIEPCKASEGLTECIKDHGNKAIQHLLEGSKSLKIPKLNPLKIPEVNVKTANLDMKYKNVVVQGMDSGKVIDAGANLESKSAFISVQFDMLNITTDYEVKGRLLLFSIDGKGPAKLDAVKPIYSCKFDWDVIKKEEKNYMKLKDFKCSSTIKRLYYYLGNLFNGNKQLEDDLNRTLNENWDKVHEEIGPGFREVIFQTIERIFRNIMEDVTYEEVFL